MVPLDRNSSLYPFTRLGLGFAAFLAVSQLAAQLLSWLAFHLSPALLSSPWGIWFLNDLSIYGFGLAALLLVLWAMPVYPPACRDRMTPASFSAIAMAAFGLMYLANLVTLLLLGALSAMEGKPFANGTIETVSSMPFLPNFVFGVILAPILEELVFRKLLLDRVRHWGDRLSILISALFFACYHTNLFQFFYAFAVGALLAYLALRTGTIRYSILLHGLINLVGVGLAPLLEQFPPAAALSGLWVLACLGVGGWQCWKFWKRRVLLEGPAPYSVGQKVSLFFRNPGTLLFLGLSLVLALLNLGLLY